MHLLLRNGLEVKNAERREKVRQKDLEVKVEIDYKSVFTHLSK